MRFAISWASWRSLNTSGDLWFWKREKNIHERKIYYYKSLWGIRCCILVVLSTRYILCLTNDIWTFINKKLVVCNLHINLDYIYMYVYSYRMMLCDAMWYKVLRCNGIRCYDNTLLLVVMSYYAVIMIHLIC